jgi:hypothetical protein
MLVLVGVAPPSPSEFSLQKTMAVNIHLSIYSYGGSLLLFAFIVTTISVL